MTLRLFRSRFVKNIFKNRPISPLKSNFSANQRNRVTYIEKKDIETVLLPGLGDSIDDAKILSTILDVGDWVRGDDAVITVETDKIIMELGAPANGKLVKYLVKESDKDNEVNVDIGSPIYMFYRGEPESEDMFVTIENGKKLEK